MQKKVSDSAFLQKTCGSETRIGLMAYAKKTLSNKKIHSTGLAAKIKEKIRSITKSFSDIDFFGCQPYA